MFCDRCGASVQPDQRFCGRCGKELAPAMTAGYPAPNRVQEHLKLLAILWFAFGAFSVLGGAIMFTLANTIFVHIQDFGTPPEVPPSFLHSVFMVIGFAILVKAAVEILAGWGLLKHESWARILAIVLAFFALLGFPFGTALGVYTLWVLLPAQSERDYAQEARMAAMS